MCLVKDYEGVLEGEVVGFTDSVVDQVVVGHENHICFLSSVFGAVVGTKEFLVRHFVQILDVERRPRGLSAFFPVFVVRTFFLDAQALCI